MTRPVDGNPLVILDAPESVSAGMPIPITMRIENKNVEPLQLYLQGRETTYDFIVTARDGDVVWRRLEGEIVPAILRVEVLGPSEILELSDTWDQRDNAGELVAPGYYSIRGTVLTDGSSTLESAALPLRIDRE